MSKILITGGAGYIGSHIVKQLSELGEKVIVFDNLTQGSPQSLLHDEQLVIGDVRNKDDLEDVFAKYDIETVIHLAALVNAVESIEKPDLYNQVNALGSKNVWEIGKKHGVKHFMYASSAAVYGTPSGQYAVGEDNPVKPESPYGKTKLQAENSLITITPPANYLAFRFFNVGGAEKEGRLHQSKNSRAIMQRAFAVAHGDDDQLTISGHDYSTKDGTVVRDFIHVQDIAFAFVLGLSYLRKGGDSHILNLGSGVDHTIGEVVREVGVIAGHPFNIQYGPRIPGDISYSLADPRKATEILGWEPVNTLRIIVRDGYNAYVQNN